jgi:hypothetical protein
LVVIAGGLAGVAACADDHTADTASAQEQSGPEQSGPDEPLPLATTVADPATDATAADSVDATDTSPMVGDVDVLDADTVERLLWLREEEQLARDVYAALGELWGLRIFENIASSEQNHLDAMADLLERYGLDDRAAGNAVGEFTDPRLQSLYDDLVAQGEVSLVAALEVGVTIEELDITDLRDLAASVEAPDILEVVSNLERG